MKPVIPPVQIVARAPLPSPRERVVSSGGSDFSPPDIAGLKLWLDPSDLSTTFQDASAATSANSNNAPVRRINDKSGEANNATASADAKRPLLKIAGGLRWLEFDGSDDCLFTGPFALNASAGEATIFLGVDLTTPASTGIVLETSANYGGSANGYVFYANSDGSSDAGVNGAGGVNAYNYTGLQSAAAVISIKFNKAVGAGSQSAVYLNGVLQAGSEVAGNSSGGVFGAESLFIGMRNDASLPQAMKIYGIIEYAGLLSDSDRGRVESYLAAKCGVTL